MGRLLALIVCALSLLVTVPVGAQDQSPRERARALGEEGLKRYDEGDFAAALAKLEEAYKIYPAPTLGLYSARSLAKLGRLIEAWQRYVQVSRTPLESDASEQLKQAKTEATSELALVERRIPVLRFEISGAESVAVTVNGESVPAGDVARGRRVNPGTYEVRGEKGDQVATAQVSIGESETKTAVLRFQTAAPVAPPPPPTAVAPAPAPAPAPTPEPSPPARDSGTKGTTQRTLGFVLIGVGAVGIGVGAVTGLIASSKKSDLETTCGDIAHCPESARGDVDSYNNLRTVSTIGFIAGGVGAAAGVVLILTAPRAQSNARRVTPYVGLGSAGVRGAF